jgi:endonuclease III
MAKASKKELVAALLDRHGETFAHELHIHVDKNTPSALFQLLNAALLMSARISARNAVRAADALRKAGLTTPRKMAEATWQDRVDVITWHGYKRYDERTSTMLGQTAELLLDRYGGDLRKLREEAERDVKKEHRLLQQFKGIGKVGADIFLREIQGVWEEAYPYADDRVLKAGRELGLGSDPKALAKLVSRRDFPRLVAALVRVDLAKAYDQLREAA